MPWNAVRIERMLMEIKYGMPLTHPNLPMVYKRYLRLINKPATFTICYTFNVEPQKG